MHTYPSCSLWVINLLYIVFDNPHLFCEAIVHVTILKLHTLIFNIESSNSKVSAQRNINKNSRNK